MTTSRWWCSLHQTYDCDCHAPKYEHDSEGVPVVSWDTDDTPAIELEPCVVCASTDPAHSEALCIARRDLMNLTAKVEVTASALLGVVAQGHVLDLSRVDGRCVPYCRTCLAQQLLVLLGKP